MISEVEALKRTLTGRVGLLTSFLPPQDEVRSQDTVFVIAGATVRYVIL